MCSSTNQGQRSILHGNVLVLPNGGSLRWGGIALTVAIAWPPNHSSDNRSTSAPLAFFSLDSIKEFTGDDSRMMILHTNLISGIGRLYLNAINNLCLP